MTLPVINRINSIIPDNYYQFCFNLRFNISGILPSLIVIAFMILSLYGFGMIIAGLTLKQNWLVSEALSGIMMVITLIAYPLAVSPIFLRKASYFIP